MANVTTHGVTTTFVEVLRNPMYDGVIRRWRVLTYGLPKGERIDQMFRSEEAAATEYAKRLLKYHG